MSRYTCSSVSSRRELRIQRLMQTQRDVGVFGCVFGGLVERDFVETDLLRALARDVFILDRLDAEMAQREVVHIVRTMRFQHVRLQQRVVFDAAHFNAVIGEHLFVVLQMLTDFLMLRAFEPRLELREHFIARQLHRRIRAAMRDRHISGMTCLNRERQAHDLRDHRIERRGFGIERSDLRCVDLLQPRVELLPRLHGFVVPFVIDGERRRHVGFRTFDRVGNFHLAQPGLEAVAREHVAQFLPRFRAALQIFLDRRDMFGQIAIAFDGDELARHRQKVERASQIVSYRTFDLVRMCDDAIQRLILRQPFERGFRPAFLDARHVVDGIADQRQVVDNALRRHAEFGEHAGTVELFVGHRIDEGDMIRHELRQILVTSRHDHVHAALFRLGGKRADHVVGFHAVDHQKRPAERAHGHVNRLDLPRQIVGHGGTIRLIVGIPVVAKRFALGVEHARAILCCDFLAHAPQHVDHPVERTRGTTVGPAQIRHRMVGPVQITRTVDQ
ncbi:hypothetical protein QF025_004267 [Paraburkholderia graminis]|uniref:NAD-specific glutamate dehydrogenase n=1 Tax=Paraburkholderia graminis TaxID=60548 RepID=A0ABD5CK00_9BURK|nr:hypothetical protein [Paraburkholderia graminis]